MKKTKMYKFVWEDGVVTYARDYDATEKAVMIRKHGKLLGKFPA